MWSKFSQVKKIHLDGGTIRWTVFALGMFLGVPSYLQKQGVNGSLWCMADIFAYIYLIKIKQNIVGLNIPLPWILSEYTPQVN